MKYLTFGDLVFRPHFLTESLGIHQGLKYAQMFFPNGFGVSVVKGDPVFTHYCKYEYAILKGTKDAFRLIENMPKFTNSKEEITLAMNATQHLTKE